MGTWSKSTVTDLWPIVLAGGSGIRLQRMTEALTGAPIPKQFCAFGSSRSLLQETLDRLRPVALPERTVVVVDATQAERAELHTRDFRGLRLIQQPRDRGTGAGVLLPLVHVIRSDPEAVVVLVPSDHGIKDVEKFRWSLALAAAHVREPSSQMVVFGAVPDAPTVDYGWIVAGERCAGPMGLVLRAVTRFVEKPLPDVAKALYGCGANWNTMVVVAAARTLFRRFSEQLPDVASVFESSLSMPEEGLQAALEAVYASLPASDFSRSILGPARELCTASWGSEVGWTDLGTPDRVCRWLAERGKLDSILPALTRLGMSAPVLR